MSKKKSPLTISLTSTPQRRRKDLIQLWQRGGKLHKPKKGKGAYSRKGVSQGLKDKH